MTCPFWAINLAADSEILNSLTVEDVMAENENVDAEDEEGNC